MAATLGYSSFFSSGLLAPQTPNSHTPRPSSPTTPRASFANLAQDDTTPTASSASADRERIVDDSQVLPSISVAPTDDSRPRLRRRRSSLAGAASPLASMKTSAPIRHAVASVQRNLRARAGSDASIMSTASASSVSTFGAAGPVYEYPTHTSALKSTGIVGRLRSGSLGTALRPRRFRRATPSVPALPPPTAPLPAVPPVPALAVSSAASRTLHMIVASPTTPVTPRRPLFTWRAQTSENYELTSAPFSVAGASPMYDDDDMDGSFVSTLPTLGLGARGLKGVGNDVQMQVDYPSPVDGGSFEWSARPPVN